MTSQNIKIPLCFLCASGGEHKMLRCQACCIPAHPYCIDQVDGYNIPGYQAYSIPAHPYCIDQVDG